MPGRTAHDILSRNTQRQVQKAHPSRSLFEQFRDAATGVVPGIVGMVASGAEEAVTRPFHTVARLAHGDIAGAGRSLAAGLPGVGGAAATLAGQAHIAGYSPAETKRLAPASSNTVESFQRTLGDVAHPSRFGQAIKEGRIVEKVLEDAANTSLVAGAAAAPLRTGATALEAASPGSRLAAGLRGASTGAETVAHLGGKVGDLPIAPARWAGRRLLGVAADRLEAAGPEALARNGRYVEPMRRSVSRLVRSSIPVREGAAHQVMANVAEQTRRAEAALPGHGEDLFTAARAHVMGLDQPIRQAAAHGMDLAPAREAAMAHDIEGHTITPGAAQIIAGHETGALPPAVRQAFDNLTAEMAASRQQQRAQAEQGYGYSQVGKGLSPAMAGTAPINPEIERLQARRPRIEQSLGRQVERAQRRLNRAETAARVPENFGPRDVERTVLDAARLRARRAAGTGPPNLPAPQAIPTGPGPVALEDLGVTARPESLLRGVTRTARAQGEALGVGREADQVATRGERAPTTTRLTAEDLAGARQARLLRGVQRAAGAPAEALAARVPGEEVLAAGERGARPYGQAAASEAEARAAARTARARVQEQLTRLETHGPQDLAQTSRAMRDQHAAELHAQADAIESRLRQITDETGPIDVRQGIGGTETRGMSDQLGRRRLAVTRYGQRLGIFATKGVQGRPVGMDVAGNIADRLGFGQLNPDELVSRVTADLEQAMNLRGEANRMQRSAPDPALGQEALANMSHADRMAAFGKAAAAFEMDSAASVAANGRQGWESIGPDKAAQAAYRMLAAERDATLAGSRTAKARAGVDVATAATYGKGIGEGQRLGRAEQLRAEGARLTGRAEKLLETARATGDLGEEQAQAQARQAGQSFAAGQTAERRLANVRTRTAELDRATAQRDSTLASVDSKIAQALAAPESYPARWRPAMQANTRWANHLRQAVAAAPDPVSGAMLAKMANEVPLLPAEMAAAGIAPEHVTFREVRPSARQTAVSSGGVGPVRQLAAEYERSNDVAPMSPKNVALVEGGEARTAASNETVKALLAPQQLDAAGKPMFDPVTNDPIGGYSRSVASVLGPNEIAAAQQRAAQRVAAERVENRPAAVRERLGQELADEMAQRGYEPWDSRAESLLSRPGAVTVDTPFLPAGTADMVRRYWAPANHNAVLAASTWLNSRWKGLVLPFSPRWQVGDMFGNYLMSTEALGIDPITLTQRMRQAAKMYRAGTLPQQLGEVGLAFTDAEKLGLSERRQARTPIGRGFRKVQAGSFHFNAYMNGIQRGAAYLELLDRNMKTGMASEPAVAKAVREANRAMGDFASMTPFERRIVTQIFPFYSWMRHITSLTGRLLIDHPERMAWTLHVGATYGNQDELPDWAKGGIPLGGVVVPGTFANPFADVMGGAALPITPSGRLGLANVGRSLSPVLKVGLAAGFGINPGRETWEATRAGGKGTDQYGRAIFEPLLGHPLELAGYAARQVPLFRTFQDVAPGVGTAGYTGGPVLRYDTGETRQRRKKDMPADAVLAGGVGGRLASLGSTFVPGFPQPVDQKQAAAIAAQRRRGGG